MEPVIKDSEDNINKIKNKTHETQSYNSESIERVLDDFKKFVEVENQKSNNELAKLNDTLTKLKISIDAGNDDNALKEHLDLVQAKYFKTQKESIATLNKSISTIPEGSYPLAIASGVIAAIVAAIAAFLITYLYQKYLNGINKKSHYADISMSLLDSFQNTAASYWVKDRITNKTNNNEEEMRVLEIKIKAEFKVLKASLNEFVSTLPDKDLVQKESITNFIGKIYDLATGGDFESEGKKSNTKVAADISSQSAKLKSILLKHTQYKS